MANSLNHLALDHLHCVDSDTLNETLVESKITDSIDIGRGVTVHHGTRDGLPIVIVELENQTDSELSCIWFDESNS